MGTQTENQCWRCRTDCTPAANLTASMPGADGLPSSFVCVGWNRPQDRTVLADRFTDSTLAYQGYGRELGEEAVRSLHRIACADLEPDLTVLLDMDPETALARARERGQANRMDEQAAQFYDRVRHAYLAMAARQPHRFHVVDARQAPETVAAAVWEAVKPLLGR